MKEEKGVKRTYDLGTGKTHLEPITIAVDEDKDKDKDKEVDESAFRRGLGIAWNIFTYAPDIGLSTVIRTLNALKLPALAGTFTRSISLIRKPGGLKKLRDDFNTSLENYEEMKRRISETAEGRDELEKLLFDMRDVKENFYLYAIQGGASPEVAEKAATAAYATWNVYLIKNFIEIFGRYAKRGVVGALRGMRKPKAENIGRFRGFFSTIRSMRDEIARELKGKDLKHLTAKDIPEEHFPKKFDAQLPKPVKAGAYERRMYEKAKKGEEILKRRKERRRDKKVEETKVMTEARLKEINELQQEVPKVKTISDIDNIISKLEKLRTKEDAEINAFTHLLIAKLRRAKGRITTKEILSVEGIPKKVIIKDEATKDILDEIKNLTSKLTTTTRPAPKKPIVTPAPTGRPFSIVPVKQPGPIALREQLPLPPPRKQPALLTLIKQLFSPPPRKQLGPPPREQLPPTVPKKRKKAPAKTYRRIKEEEGILSAAEASKRYGADDAYKKIIGTKQWEDFWNRKDLAETWKNMNYIENIKDAKEQLKKLNPGERKKLFIHLNKWDKKTGKFVPVKDIEEKKVYSFIKDFSSKPNIFDEIERLQLGDADRIIEIVSEAATKLNKIKFKGAKIDEDELEKAAEILTNMEKKVSDWGDLGPPTGDVRNYERVKTELNHRIDMIRGEQSLKNKLKEIGGKEINNLLELLKK